MRWLSSKTRMEIIETKLQFRFVSIKGVSTTKADWLRVWGTILSIGRLTSAFNKSHSFLVRYSPVFSPGPSGLRVVPSHKNSSVFDRHLWFLLVRFGTFIDKLGDLVGIGVVFVWYLHHKCPLKYIFYIFLWFFLFQVRSTVLFFFQNDDLNLFFGFWGDGVENERVPQRGKRHLLWPFHQEPAQERP